MATENKPAERPQLLAQTDQHLSLSITVEKHVGAAPSSSAPQSKIHPAVRERLLSKTMKKPVQKIRPAKATDDSSDDSSASEESEAEQSNNAVQQQQQEQIQPEQLHQEAQQQQSYPDTVYTEWPGAQLEMGNGVGRTLLPEQTVKGVQPSLQAYGNPYGPPMRSGGYHEGMSSAPQNQSFYGWPSPMGYSGPQTGFSSMPGMESSMQYSPMEDHVSLGVLKNAYGTNGPYSFDPRHQQQQQPMSPSYYGFEEQPQPAVDPITMQTLSWGMMVGMSMGMALSSTFPQMNPYMQAQSMQSALDQQSQNPRKQKRQTRKRNKAAPLNVPETTDTTTIQQDQTGKQKVPLQ